MNPHDAMKQIDVVVGGLCAGPVRFVLWSAASDSGGVSVQSERHLAVWLVYHVWLGELGAAGDPRFERAAACRGDAHWYPSRGLSDFLSEVSVGRRETAYLLWEGAGEEVGVWFSQWLQSDDVAASVRRGESGSLSVTLEPSVVERAYGRLYGLHPHVV